MQNDEKSCFSIIYNDQYKSRSICLTYFWKHFRIMVELLMLLATSQTDKLNMLLATSRGRGMQAKMGEDFPLYFQKSATYKQLGNIAQKYCLLMLGTPMMHMYMSSEEFPTWPGWSKTTTNTTTNIGNASTLTDQPTPSPTSKKTYNDVQTP